MFQNLKQHFVNDLKSDNRVIVSVTGIDVPIFIKRNARAKRMILRVNETQREVNITIPKSFSIKKAKLFAEQHRTWINEKFHALPPIIPFEDGHIIPFKGNAHRIHFSGIKRGQQTVSIIPGLEPAEHPKLCVNGITDHAPRRLKDWLKKQARLDLDERVQHHANVLGLRPKRLSVRDQKSRWGSCSSTGVLSFSWRLVLAPYFVLDYVAAHEVAHLAEMNHGPRFWQLVRKTMPDMDNAEQWLKTYGTDLHRYGQI